MGELLANINWWAAILGGAAYFAIGAIWYGPIFGKAWMAEQDMQEHPEEPEPILFGYTLILQIICGISLAIFAGALDIHSALSGLYLGLAASAGFVATTVGVNGVYNDMSLRLFFIDAGYHLVGFAAAGAIIGAW